MAFTMWRFFLICQSILYFTVVVFWVIPMEKFCMSERVMAAILTNVSITNKLQCETVGIKLGFNENELDKNGNLAHLVAHLMDDRMHNGLDHYRRTILSGVIEKEAYAIENEDVVMLKDFEVCAAAIEGLSLVSLYVVFFLFITTLTILVSRTFKNWTRQRRCRNERVRTDSENTCNEGSSIRINNPTYNNNSTVNKEAGSSHNTNKLMRFLSCILGRPQRVTSESESGQDNSTPRRLFKREIDATLRREGVHLVHEAMKSVGILFTKQNGKGTVVRIGPNFVITAWHVIKDIVLPANLNLNKRPINPTLLQSETIYVDFHDSCRQSPTFMHFHILPKIPFWNPDLDIVILELDVSKNEEHLPPPFVNFADVFELNSRENQIPCVHIIGQHPKEENVVLDPGCKIITRDDKNVKRAREWIKQNMTSLKQSAKKNNDNPNNVETAYYDVFSCSRSLIFDTYLEFGGSGGAVIALLPEGGVALVAILTHGLPPFYWYASTNHIFPENMRMEVGCTMEAITDSDKWTVLGAESLRDELFCPGNIRQPMETDAEEPDQTDVNMTTLAENLNNLTLAENVVV